MFKVKRFGIALFITFFLPCYASAQLFQLSNEDGIKGYLFGSTHGPIGGIQVRSEIIVELIQQSRIVVLETANGIPLVMRRSRLSVPSGSTVFDALPANLRTCSVAAYDEMRQGIKANTEISTLLNLNPVFLAFAYLGFSLDKLKPLDTAASYDRLITNAALNSLKPIADLEPAAEKIDLLLKIAPVDVSSIICGLCEVNATGRRTDVFRSLQNSIVDAYLQADMDQLTERHKSMYKLLGASDLFIDLFWAKRNNLMANKIAGLVNNGYQPFIAIGASHLGGTDGVLALLAAKGLQVLAVPHTRK